MFAQKGKKKKRLKLPALIQMKLGFQSLPSSFMCIFIKQKEEKSALKKKKVVNKGGVCSALLINMLNIIPLCHLRLFFCNKYTLFFSFLRKRHTRMKHFFF